MSATASLSTRAARLAAVSLIAGAIAMSAPSGAQGASPPLQALAVRSVGSSQGVYAVAQDGTVLAAVNESRAVHPASVTKIPSTLVLLDHLGPTYRFETLVSASGPSAGGVLDGDVVVESRGDPFFVFESAFLVLAELRALGVRRVAGNLRVSGPFLFNWQPDTAGARLLDALAGRDGVPAWRAVAAHRPDLAGVSLADAALVFGSRPAPAREPHVALVRYRSPPLASILKALNCYSNNVFQPLSSAVGGPSRVEAVARERAGGVPRAEIVIHNAAGAGTTNRMSPRAAVALVRALITEAAEHGLVLADLMPVGGLDPGTLRDRLSDPGVRAALVGKTGTYGSLGASALAGILYTKRWGEVAFAVLNKGLDVPTARERQDAFVRGVLSAGGAVALSRTAAAPTPLFEASVQAVR